MVLFKFQKSMPLVYRPYVGGVQWARLQQEKKANTQPSCPLIAAPPGWPIRPAGSLPASAKIRGSEQQRRADRIRTDARVLPRVNGPGELAMLRSTAGG